MSYVVACLGHCLLLALTYLLSNISVMTRTDWGLDLDLLGLEGHADCAQCLRRETWEGVISGTSVALQTHRCWWRLVYPGPALEAE